MLSKILRRPSVSHPPTTSIFLILPDTTVSISNAKTKKKTKAKAKANVFFSIFFFLTIYKCIALHAIRLIHVLLGMSVFKTMPYMVVK